VPFGTNEMNKSLAIILGFCLSAALVFTPVCNATVPCVLAQFSKKSQAASPGEPQAPEEKQSPASQPSSQPEKQEPTGDGSHPTEEQSEPRRDSQQNPTQPNQEPKPSTPEPTSPSAPAVTPEPSPEQTPQAAPQQPASESPAVTNPDKPKHNSVSPKVPKPSSTKAKSGSTTSARKSRKKRTKPPAPLQANGEPAKRVVREGGTSEPAEKLSPSISDEQASHARQNTDQLLASTDENLKKATVRTLTPNQQETLAQIRKFMEQASAAVNAGDFQRGHNLALKAHMLSDDLVKH